MKSLSSTDDADGIVEAFLDGAPSADTWEILRKTLQDRLNDARQQLTKTPEPERHPLVKRIQELEGQVHALAQEEAITRFVEDSVRAMIARPRAGDSSDDED